MDYNKLFSLSFEEILSHINFESFENFLKNLSSPVSEAYLINWLFPKVSILQYPPYLLYRLHFILLHILYKLKIKFYEENLYIHISCLSIITLPYPPNGKCRYFDNYFLKFCNTDCSSRPLNKIDRFYFYCDFHKNKFGNNQIDFVSAYHFYQNKENFYLINEENSKMFLEGGLQIVLEYKKIIEAYQKLGIALFSDIEKVRSRYKELVHKFHPDKITGNSKEFIEIINAYNVIASLLSKLRISQSNIGNLNKID